MKNKQPTKSKGEDIFKELNQFYKKGYVDGIEEMATRLKTAYAFIYDPDLREVLMDNLTRTLFELRDSVEAK